MKAGELQAAADVLERMHKHFSGLSAAATTLRDIAALQNLAEECEQRTVRAKSELASVDVELAKARLDLGAAQREAEVIVANARTEAEDVITVAKRDAANLQVASKTTAERMLAEANAAAAAVKANAERVAREAEEFAKAEHARAAEAQRTAEAKNQELAEIEQRMASIREKARSL